MGEAKRRGTLEDRIKNADFKCIICRLIKKAVERSDEHVIPDSLNGYYHIYSVCKTCNSDMGAAVDGVLLNHKLAQLYRFSEGISGKSGKIPNPFNEIKSIKDNPNVSVKTEISNDGKITYKYLPKVETEENEDGTLKSFNIFVDSRDKRIVESIRQKIIKRNKLENIKLITKENIESVIERPELTGEWQVDTLKFKLGLLKIGYEFAVDSIDEYFNDPLAIKISEILRNGSYERINELRIGSGLDSEIFKSVENIFDINKKRHILMLLSIDKGLVCFIKIDNVFHIGIQLSERRYMPFEHSIIGINDLEAKNFTRKLLFQFMEQSSGLTYFRLGYWIPNNGELFTGQYEPASPDFKYELNSKGDPKIYKKNGNIHQTSWNSLLLKHQTDDIEFKEGMYIQRFSFGGNLGLYVKSIVTGKLYEFRSFELSREFNKI